MVGSLNFLKNMNNHTKISVNVVAKGFGAVEAEFSGEGLNELLHFLLKASLVREL